MKERLRDRFHLMAARSRWTGWHIATALVWAVFGIVLVTLWGR